MPLDFYRPIENVRMHKLNESDRARNGARIERAVRLYCTMHAAAWQLQIRSPMGVGSFGLQDGKDDVIAGASLSREDLLALRGAIDQLLEEAA